jgi:hypothetical protein
VAAAAPPLRLAAADEPEVRLVDERGGLEGLAGSLLGHPRGGELAQLVVDEREQFLRGAGVALVDGVQDPRDVGHDGKHTRAAVGPRPETGLGVGVTPAGHPDPPTGPCAHLPGRRSSNRDAGSDGRRRRASRRDASGSSPVRRQVPTTEYRTAADRPPASLPANR